MIDLVTANLKISSDRKILSSNWHVTLIPSFLYSVTHIQSSSYWKHWHAPSMWWEPTVWGNRCSYRAVICNLNKTVSYYRKEKLNFQTKGKNCGARRYKMYRVWTGGTATVYQIHWLDFLVQKNWSPVGFLKWRSLSWQCPFASESWHEN